VQQNFDLQQNFVALHSYVMRLTYLKSISYINSAMAYYLLIDMKEDVATVGRHRQAFS
jgi:hypothetical protein